MDIIGKADNKIETYSQVRIFMSPKGNLYVDDGTGFMYPVLTPTGLPNKYCRIFCDLKNEITKQEGELQNDKN